MGLYSNYNRNSQTFHSIKNGILYSPMAPVFTIIVRRVTCEMDCSSSHNQEMRISYSRYNCYVCIRFYEIEWFRNSKYLQYSIRTKISIGVTRDIHLGVSETFKDFSMTSTRRIRLAQPRVLVVLGSRQSPVRRYLCSTNELPVIKYNIEGFTKHRISIKERV